MSRRATHASPMQAHAKKVFIYARVSSKEQEREGYSIDAQLNLLREYAAREGFEVAKEYVEAETAKKAGRVAFNKMVARVRKLGGGTILVEKSDRLLRNLKDWVTIEDLIDEFDVDLHFPKEGGVISSASNSAAKFMFRIRCVMNRQFVDNLSEETSKGMRTKAEQGIYPSFAPLGYVNTPDKRIEIDHERGPIIKQLFDLYATGNYALTEIAKEARTLGLTYRKSGAPVTKSSVSSLLRSRLYTGWFEWNGELYQGTHAPIVSLGVWEKVQRIRRDRYNFRTRRTKRMFPYARLLKCAHCGRAIVGEMKKKKHIYYHCSGYSRDGKKPACARKYVTQAALEQQFIDLLGQLSIDKDIFKQMRNALKASHSDVKREREKMIHKHQIESDQLQKRIDAMYIDKIDGIISNDYFLRVSAHLRDKLIIASDEIKALWNTESSYMELGIGLLELARNSQTLLVHQTDIGKRNLLKLLLSNRVLSDGKVSADFRKPLDLLAQAKIAVDSATTEKERNENWLPGPDSNQRHGG